MKHLMTWLFTLADSLAIVVIMRWMFRLGTPKRDWWQVERVAARVGRWIRGWRVHLRDWLGLTESAWQRLRDQYRAGRYGVEGT